MSPILSKTVRLAHLVEDGALVIALVSMLLMALLQIAMRNFFDSGFLWAESFLRILVLWVAMLGAMVATRERNHINIDILSKFLDPSVMRLLRVLTNLFAAGVCFVSVYYAVEFIQYEFQDGTIAFASMPVWICQSIIPIGFAVMGLRFLITLGLERG
ncbi:MAG: TRAP transporter small permease subunit [Gammaproteobacteria bacterium]|jgi:TRAP-type C4-dicarboxylate transport system permease small subunit|nr:TRAP transporter small permease subunit [Gammaproteobacteria bacterium]MBT4493254.1 TRAP transporter small permease subunit [Gammaproteobacteria bacterium]MBT7369496.1 TRAP transporter small permease subunit [Gammaproteobacteria bacterium]